jgi:PrsW family intramembrane metalloprotease
VGSEYIGPDFDAARNRSSRSQSVSLEKGDAPAPQDNDTSDDNDATQPLRAVRLQKVAKVEASQEPAYQEPAYQEHVTGSLVVHPAEAPYFRPAYQPYQPPAPQRPAQQPGPGYPPTGYQPGNGYPTGYTQPTPYAPYAGHPPYNEQNGYPQAPYPAYPQQYYNYPAYGYPPYGYQPYGYPYPWQPPQPKRDGYLLGMSISAFAGSFLVFLAGIVSVLFLLLIAAVPGTQSLSQAVRFSAIVQVVAFAVAGLVGGSFTFYHSFRSLFLKRRSAQFKMPWFWIFFALYLVVVLIAAAMRANGQAVTSTPLTIFMIALAGILPSLTIIALGVRRIHFPREARWPTTWRRFAVALVSGATLAIMLALVFELVLTVVLEQQLGIKNIALDNPDQPVPHDVKSIIFLLLIVSVVAPLVEEGVKPLAVAIMSGRLRSAGEAFVLGLACGTGFNLIETSGYMSMGYNNWLDVALQRTSSGLLHGFGAAMVSLGWYYLTHPKASNHRFLLPLGCWGYAVLQHAIWNGSFVVALLPAPIGPFLDNGTVPLGPLSFPAIMLVYGALTIVMLIFFFYVTKKIRPKKSLSQPEAGKPSIAAAQQPVAV